MTIFVAYGLDHDNLICALGHEPLSTSKFIVRVLSSNSICLPTISLFPCSSEELKTFTSWSQILNCLFVMFCVFPYHGKYFRRGPCSQVQIYVFSSKSLINTCLHLWHLQKMKAQILQAVSVVTSVLPNQMTILVCFLLISMAAFLSNIYIINNLKWIFSFCPVLIVHQSHELVI